MPFIMLSEREIDAIILAKRGWTMKLYLILVEHRNRKTKQCNPSILRISKEYGVSRSVIQYARKELEELGLLSVEKKIGESSQYNFPLRDPYVHEMERGGVPTVKGTPANGKGYPPANGKGHKPEEVVTRRKNHIVAAFAAVKEKTSLQRLVEGYFDLKGYTMNNPQQRDILFKRHVRPAKDILTLSKGRTDIALKAIRIVKNWAESHDLSWTLETVTKRWKDIPSLPQRKENR